MDRHDKCLDCQSRPRAGMGRWLCEPCEDSEFGYVATPAADLTAANMRSEEVRRAA
jgi:ribosomal protein L37AE/L43A